MLVAAKPARGRPSRLWRCTDTLPPSCPRAMVLIHVKYGEASMASAVFNPDCESATLLDYVRKRCVKDTEAYARGADARVSAFIGEVANDLQRARASLDRCNRNAAAEVDPEADPEVDAEDADAQAEQEALAAAATQAAAKVEELEQLEALRTAQKDALISGVGLFEGLDAVDLQEEGGAALNLRSDPKRNAKDVLGHRKTYVVVRVGAPPRPPPEPREPSAEEGGDAEPEAEAPGPDPDAIIPLTFEVPPDPVEEPAAEAGAAEEGAAE